MSSPEAYITLLQHKFCAAGDDHGAVNLQAALCVRKLLLIMGKLAFNVIKNSLVPTCCLITISYILDAIGTSAVFDVTFLVPTFCHKNILHMCSAICTALGE